MSKIKSHSSVFIFLCCFATLKTIQVTLYLSSWPFFYKFYKEAFSSACSEEELEGSVASCHHLILGATCFIPINIPYTQDWWWLVISWYWKKIDHFPNKIPGSLQTIFMQTVCFAILTWDRIFYNYMGESMLR